MDKTFKHHKKINNEGSALVTVIIVAFFLSVIVTTLLFVTVKNYKARQIEYQSKQNFYETEKTLDELRAIMIEDCSTACLIAYTDVMNEYLEMSVEQRHYTYNQKFVNNFRKIWDARMINDDTKATLRSVLTSDFAENIEDADNFEYHELEGYILIKNITVSTSSIEGYYTRVISDIRIDTPFITWDNDGSNDEIHTLNMKDYVSFVDWHRD